MRFIYLDKAIELNNTDIYIGFKNSQFKLSN